MDGFKKSGRALWDEHWEYADKTIGVGSVWEYWDLVKFEFLLRLFPSHRRSLTLECGCGSATISAWLSKLRYETIAVDFSREALRVARNNFKSLDSSGNFILCDLEYLPFQENVFDVVMSFGVFEHFVNPKPHTQEMIRTLRPNGLLFADVVPQRFNIQTIGLWILRKLYELTTRSNKSPPFFEIQMNAIQLKKFFQEFALLGLTVAGNNPFPTLPIPSKIYIKIMRKLKRFHTSFDGSWLALLLGRGLWVYGFKQPITSKIG